MTTAPACPISNGQYPYGRNWAKTDPRTPIKTLIDKINMIPKAVDLPSAILALNRINNIIMELTRGAPVVNNIRQEQQPDLTIKGEDYNPYYQPQNWNEDARDYTTERLENANDSSQYIDIKVLSYVRFFNPNTSTTLDYYGRYGGS